MREQMSEQMRVGFRFTFSPPPWRSKSIPRHIRNLPETRYSAAEKGVAVCGRGRREDEEDEEEREEACNALQRAEEGGVCHWMKEGFFGEI